jgi:hypothetical protein
MNAFFDLAHPFTGHPERAYLVALVFLALALVDRWLARFDPSTRPWAMFVPAAAWLGYAINEHYARQHDIAVRFDIYLIWPVLALITVLFAGVWLLNVRRVARAYRSPPSDGR